MDLNSNPRPVTRLDRGVHARAVLPICLALLLGAVACSRKGANQEAAAVAGGTNQATAGEGSAIEPPASSEKPLDIGPGAVARGKTGGAVASVAGKELPYKAFERYLNDNAGEDTGEGEPLDAIRSRLLDQFIEEQLLLGEADRLKVAVSDAEVDSYLHELGVSESDLDVGAPDGKEAFRERVKTGLVVQKVKEAAVLKTVHVSPGEVDDEMKKRPDATQAAAQVVLRQILFDDRNAAEEAHRKLQTDPSQFEAVARLKSAAPDKGAPRAYSEDDLPDDLRTAVGGLQPGQVSPVIEHSQAFVVLQLVKRVDAAPVDLAEVRKRVESELFRQKADQVMERYLADLKDKTDIRVHRALLPFKYIGDYKG
jgi:parvulin-like peptidyl-prolyl isomerase